MVCILISNMQISLLVLMHVQFLLTYYIWSTELHVLIVTSREYVGKYHGSSIYKILSMKFLHCHSITRTLSQGEVSCFIWIFCENSDGT